MSRVPQIKNLHSPTLLAAAAALIAVSALSGCSAFRDRQHITVGAVPDDYRTNHPIVISEQEETLDVPVAVADTHISVAQSSSIGGFVSQYSANGSGFVQILLPAGSANAAAAHRVHPHVVQALRKAGVPARNIVSATYDAQAIEATAPIRISYRAMSAATDPCGKWPGDLSETTENRNYENFACASQNNLAAMIANPADLIGPRLPGAIDPVKRGLAISRYQKSTGTWSANTQYSW
jgi:pilus assembly protein CpaD